MSKLVLCDVCGRILTRNFVSNPVRRDAYLENGVKFMVQIQLGKAATWNDGDLCGPCLRIAVNEVLADEEVDTAVGNYPHEATP